MPMLTKQWKKMQNRRILKQLQNANIEDLKLLSRVIYEKSSEIAPQNNCYGIAANLKKYCGIDDNIPLQCTIEHGICLIKDFVNPVDVVHNVPVICMGEYRTEVLRRHGKEAYSIGPYIAYVEGSYPKDRVDKLKKEYGKTLLVFPPHSTEKEHAEYEIDRFILKIEDIRKKQQFQTVMVCMYWLDMNNGYHKEFKKRGYKIVSSGCGNDFNFLARQKTILELAEAVVFGAITTGLGYAMYMKKPCFIYKQKVDFVKQEHVVFEWQNVGDEYKQLEKVFSGDDFIITQEQIDICNYVFGLNEVKTKQELRRIIWSVK